MLRSQSISVVPGRRRRRLSVVAVFAAAAMLALSPVTAADSVDAANNEFSGSWFVELSSAPVAAGGRLSQTQRDKKQFRSAAERAGIRFTERFAFDKLWNGLSIEVDDRDISRITGLKGVKAVYPVVSASIGPQPVSRGELASAIAMTGADLAQSSLGFDGSGVRVAVMDTGIDYDHPDLGGCFGSGCRVAVGHDFVGDAYTGPGSTPVPDDDPDDCNGHGTHVAGIVGADGDVTGVAPGVTFGAYRVFGCSGSTSADIMIAAMERALEDDMDVLNMSIGSSFQWPQYPTASASDLLVNNGMTVVASFGNSGSSGLYSGSAPGVGKKVIAVASVDNDSFVVPSFTVNGTSIGYDVMAFSVDPPTSGSEEIVFVGQGCDADLPLGADPSGKVALIVRGGCTFREKAENAEDAGATAAVVHNSSPGLFFGTLGEPGIGIPVVSISQEDGLFIRAQAAPVTMTWTDEQITVANPTGGLISGFSSYGLSPDLALKPDISAPGGFINSTYPLELGGYATLSGTSMAAPHVAGSAALLLQADPNTPSQAVRRILQNSADPFVWWASPASGFLDNVHRQGAGLVDVDDAILAGTRIEPGKISLGEGEAGTQTVTLSVENNDFVPVTYDLSHVTALSTGGVISPSFFLSNAGAAFSAGSLMVDPGSTATVDVTISPATGPTFGQYGGYIVFTPQGGGQTHRVPYAGFVGDYQGITVLEPTPSGFPWLATLSGDTYFNEPDGATYTMEGGDVPFILVHLEHQSRRLKMEVFDANTGRAHHTALEFEYVGRNSTPTGFFALPWDGTTVNGRKLNVLPDGDYVIRLSVQKALGDDENPDHTEEWISPVITIARP